MKRIVLLFAAALLGGFIGASVVEVVVRAQTPVAMQLTGNAPHTTCPVVASQTTYCLANDGIWQSINGAAFVQLTPATAGVSSITVCNAAGASCGTAQTGAVQLSIPKSASTTLQ